MINTFFFSFAQVSILQFLKFHKFAKISVLQALKNVKKNFQYQKQEDTHWAQGVQITLI